jgi:hypothetical protein
LVNDEVNSKFEEAHFCDIMCPSCGHYCEKDFGHAGLHKTTHGNILTQFVSEYDTVELELVRMEITEMCGQFCQKLGRGHLHVVACTAKDATSCPHSHDKRRHSTTRYFPNPDEEKDELTHEAFWQLYNFEDPCHGLTGCDDFNRCPHMCPRGHEDDGRPKRSYCELPLWHVPAKDADAKIGQIVFDRHIFSCKHPQVYHTLFCLDDSSSMKGDRWTGFITAVKFFLRHRIENGGEDDIVTFVVYNTSARIEATGKSGSWLKGKSFFFFNSHFFYSNKNRSCTRACRPTPVQRGWDKVLCWPLPSYR